MVFADQFLPDPRAPLSKATLEALALLPDQGGLQATAACTQGIDAEMEAFRKLARQAQAPGPSPAPEERKTPAAQVAAAAETEEKKTLATQEAAASASGVLAQAIQTASASQHGYSFAPTPRRAATRIKTFNMNRLPQATEAGVSQWRSCKPVIMEGGAAAVVGNCDASSRDQCHLAVVDRRKLFPAGTETVEFLRWAKVPVAQVRRITDE